MWKGAKMGDDQKSLPPALLTAGGALLSALVGGTCRLLSDVAPVLVSRRVGSTLNPAPSSNLLYGI